MVCRAQEASFVLFQPDLNQKPQMFWHHKLHQLHEGDSAAT